MKQEKGRKGTGPAVIHAASECGAEHSDCPNTWKGTCDREAGHDGSHHCSQCNSAF